MKTTLKLRCWLVRPTDHRDGETVHLSYEPAMTGPGCFAFRDDDGLKAVYFNVEEIVRVDECRSEHGADVWHPPASGAPGCAPGTGDDGRSGGYVRYFDAVKAGANAQFDGVVETGSIQESWDAGLSASAAIDEALTDSLNMHPFQDPNRR